MAKPLGPKSRLIREALGTHPDTGNTELAELINDADERMDDKIKVTAQDVAAQRQAMKKPGALTVPAAVAEPAAAQAAPKQGNGRRKAGRKPGRKPKAAISTQTAVAKPAPRPATDTATHVEAIREAVKNLGSAQVKRIADLFE
jgi:hypothetical protein